MSNSLDTPINPNSIKRDGPIQVPSNAQSYAITMQGDTYSPETVMITTRNLKNASDSQRRAWYKSKGGRNSEDVWKYPNTDRPWSKHIGAAHIPDGGMLGYATQFHGYRGWLPPLALCMTMIIMLTRAVLLSTGRISQR